MQRFIFYVDCYIINDMKYKEMQTMDGMNLTEIFGSYNSWKLDEKTWCINFMNGSQNMYLLEGDEKALLIDTGFGAGNLKEYVETLTKKPLLVFNTHFHPDHSAGNGEFPEVYMSEGAKIDELSVTESFIIPFDLKAMPHPDYKKIFIKEGFVFELGNRNVEVLDVLPAHSNSSLFLIDKKHRMFFTGDDMESQQVLMFDNSNNPKAPYEVNERLMNFKHNLLRIKSFFEDFDYLLPNHNGFPISKSYVDTFIELIDGIFRGYIKPDEKLNHKYLEMDPKADRLCRIRWNDVSIFMEREEFLKVKQI